MEPFAPQDPLQAAQSQRPVPVMDVVMPKTEPTQPRPVTPPTADQYATVTIPAASEAAPIIATPVAPASIERSDRKAAPAAPGVTLAIIATVLIVLGIAALVTLAYLRTT